MEQNALSIVLEQLTPIILDEKKQAGLIPDNPYYLFYIDTMTSIKYDIKWYGLRQKSEFFTILQRLTYSRAIAIGDTVVKDDESPSLRFSLLNRITQCAYAQIAEGTWNAAANIFVQRVCFMYNEINDALGFGELQSEFLQTPALFNGGDSNDYTVDDLKCHMDNEQLLTILKQNPLIATIAFMSLLPADTLFFEPAPNITKGVDI